MEDVTILFSAIAFLVGAVGTIAKLAWDERGRRVDSSETQANYYRDEIPKLLDGLIEQQKKQDNTMSQLADVVEHALHKMNEQNRAGG